MRFTLKAADVQVEVEKDLFVILRRTVKRVDEGSMCARLLEHNRATQCEHIDPSHTRDDIKADFADRLRPQPQADGWR